MATIYDAYGRPVNVSDLLRKDKAGASLTGIRQPWHDPVATGLTPYKLAQILLAASQGDHWEYLTLAEEMEEREMHYASVLGTRRLAVRGLQVGIEAYDDSAKEMRIADELRALTKEDSFVKLKYDLTDAAAKGYSVSEIEWDRSERQWWPDKFVWRDPRYFLFDRTSGETLLLADESNMEGIPLAPMAFVQHRASRKNGLAVRGGLAFLAARGYVCKSFTVKDWMAFAEVFGMPLRLGKYPSSATQEDKDTLLVAVANLGSDAAAVMPDTMMLEIVDAAKSTGGERIFAGLADFWNKETSKAILGQTMSSEDGASLAQAKVHDKVRGDILEADGIDLAATLQRDLIKPYIDINYGPRKRNEYPTITLKPKEVEDLAALAKSLPPFIDRGLRVQSSLILDKFGLAEADEGAEILGAKAAAAPVSPMGGGDDDDEGDDTPTPPKKAKQTALNAEEGDQIDEMVALALAKWEQVTDDTGIIGTMRRLIDEATSYDDLTEKLEEFTASVDSATFVRELGVQLFQARGLGDATDTV